MKVENCTDHKTFTPLEQEVGLRLDRFLASHLDCSRSKIQSLIKDSKVTVADKPITNASHSVRLGEIYKVVWSLTVATDDSNIGGYNFPLNILYEDDCLLILNKQVGLVVHPGAGNYDNTLVNALVFHYRSHSLSKNKDSRQVLSMIRGADKQGIVHRLDKNTSGLMVIAKTDQAHCHLAQQFANQQVLKKYRALVSGLVKPVEGIIDNILMRNPYNRLKMVVKKPTTAFLHPKGEISVYRKALQEHGLAYSAPQLSSNKGCVLTSSEAEGEASHRVGKRAITNYKVLLNDLQSKVSLVECHLQTGRTHQIRVHFANLGHALIGDSLYGNGYLKNNSLGNVSQFATGDRQALHAYLLEFTHPMTQQRIRIVQDEPQDLQNLYTTLLPNYQINKKVWDTVATTTEQDLNTKIMFNGCWITNKA